MSTVVAVKKNNRLCIAADTLTTFGEMRQSHDYDVASDKIHGFGEHYMAIVGSAAHHVVMEHLLKRYENTQLNSRMAVFEWLKEIHPILKEEYFLNPKEEDDDPYESSRLDALLINASGIYGVFALREVFEYSRFWAIGSGSEYAMGAMHVAYDQFDDAKTIAEKAVAASCEFSTGSALPLTSYCVDLA